MLNTRFDHSPALSAQGDELSESDTPRTGKTGCERGGKDWDIFCEISPVQRTQQAALQDSSNHKWHPEIDF
jgi:hypothetical protein